MFTPEDHRGVCARACSDTSRDSLASLLLTPARNVPHFYRHGPVKQIWTRCHCNVCPSVTRQSQAEGVSDPLVPCWRCTPVDSLGASHRVGSYVLAFRFIFFKSCRLGNDVFVENRRRGKSERSCVRAPSDRTVLAGLTPDTPRAPASGPVLAARSLAGGLSQRLA